MIRPRPTSPLFPYTTLFRSGLLRGRDHVRLSEGRHRRERAPASDHRTRAAAARHREESSAGGGGTRDRKSTRLNSSHSQISYAVFCLKKISTGVTPQASKRA